MWILTGPADEGAPGEAARPSAAEAETAVATPPPGDALDTRVPSSGRREAEPSEAMRSVVDAPAASTTDEGGASLVGRVVDLDLRPAAGVTVTLAGCAMFLQSDQPIHVPSGRLLDARMTTTDDEGRFSFDGVPPREGYWLRATTSAGSRAGLTGLVVHPDGGDAGTLLLEPACRVRGRLEDRSGRPIAGVPVDVDLVVDDAVSRSDGTFELTLPEGEHRLRVGAPEWVDRRSASRPFLAGTEVSVVLVLDPAAPIRGRVVTTRGVPVPGAVVRGPDTEDVTGADGSFSIGGCAAGTTADLRVEHEGYAFEYRPDVPAGATNVLVVLADAARVDVTCVDEEANRVSPTHLAVASIDGDRPLEEEGILLWHESIPPIPNPDGTWSVHVPGAARSVVARGRAAGGLVAWGGPVAMRGDGASVTLRFEKGARLPVRVVAAEDGRPIARAAVRVATDAKRWSSFLLATVVTGDDGRAVVEGLPPAEWSVEAAARGYAGAEAASVVVKAGEELRELRVALLLPGALAGTLVGDDGRPVERWPLELWAPRREGRFRTVTDGSGAFTFESVPAGLVILRTPRRGYRVAVGEGAWHDVRAGETTRVEARLSRQPAGAASILVRSNGVARTDSPVRAFPHPDPNPKWERMLRRTDAEGQALFDVLRPGGWQIHLEDVLGPTELLPLLTVEDGRVTEQAFEVPVGRLSLAFVDAQNRRPITTGGEVRLCPPEEALDERPKTTWPIRFEPALALDSLGRVVAETVRAGRYGVAVSVKGHRRAGEGVVEVRAGETTEATLALEEVPLLRITLDGAPTKLSRLTWKVVDRLGTTLAHGVTSSPDAGREHLFPLEGALASGLVVVEAEDRDAGRRYRGSAPLVPGDGGWSAAHVQLARADE